MLRYTVESSQSGCLHEKQMEMPAQVRTIVQQEMQNALSNLDALISPVAPTTAYKLGHVKDDPLEMYKGDIMTINVNLAGQRPYSLRPNNSAGAMHHLVHGSKRMAAFI